MAADAKVDDIDTLNVLFCYESKIVAFFMKYSICKHDIWKFFPSLDQEMNFSVQAK